MTPPAPRLIRDFRSPNSGVRLAVDGEVAVRHLVLHYTGMATGAEALARLCDPAAEVSAHYLIEEDGRTYALVDEEQRAWHAGRAFWRGVHDINSTSIGIELVNPGHAFGYRPFPEAQTEALIALTADIKTRHRIDPQNVVGHSDVAPGRKRDPGELFPWRKLADAGIGLWPRGRGALTETPWAALSAIGYAVPDGPGAEILDPANGARDVLMAFQQRFRPQAVDGIFDEETRRQISAVAAHIPTT